MKAYTLRPKRDGRIMKLHLPPKTMKQLFGGKWPTETGFNYDSVFVFKLEGGVWQPYGQYGDILPGPAIKITAKELPCSLLTMIDLEA